MPVITHLFACSVACQFLTIFFFLWTNTHTLVVFLIHEGIVSVYIQEALPITSNTYKKVKGQEVRSVDGASDKYACET
jgi:hypothetical protein